jgi:hypothetical protein
MTLVYIGLSFTGALMAISASGVFAAIKRKVRRNPFGQRTGPKVNTIIQVRKENQNEY